MTDITADVTIQTTEVTADVTALPTVVTADVTTSNNEVTADVTVLDTEIDADVTISPTIITADVAIGMRGEDGTDGVDGVSGVNLILTTTAEIDLGGLRLVANGTQFGKVVYANNDDPTHKLNIVGVTQGAVLADESVLVVTGGYMQDSSWSWVRGPLYVGLNGTITQTPPITGFIKIVGTAVDTNKIQIHLKNSITLL